MTTPASQKHVLLKVRSPVKRMQEKVVAMDKMGWMGCLHLSYKGHNAFFLLILALSERDAEGKVPHPCPVDVTPIPLRKIKVT